MFEFLKGPLRRAFCFSAGGRAADRQDGLIYTIDDKDAVHAIDGLPQSSIGAPLPSILATDKQTFLVYLVEDPSPGWDGTSVRAMNRDVGGEAVAIISFENCHAHFLGPPSDEIFHGHPLAPRGLRPYGVFEVEHSSWLRALVRMNAVHPRHMPGMFADCRHFIFTFHDSTFECIAESFAVETARMSIKKALSELLGKRL